MILPLVQEVRQAQLTLPQLMTQFMKEMKQLRLQSAVYQVEMHQKAVINQLQSQ